MNRAGEVVASLLKARGVDRLHHAYGFFGPVGVGKKEAVAKFAAEVFASADGGGLFGTPDPTAQAERIARGNHPDFVRVAPQEGSIKVDDVREVIRSVAFAPLEAPMRIVLVEDAHKMNMQATNALLKTLEEPPAHTVFFLTTPDAELLLQTVRSRCQLIRFFPLPEEELKRRLGDSQNLDTVAAFAEGSLERARDLLASPEALALRTEACEALLEMWEACPRITPKILSLAEGLKEEGDLNLVLDSWTSLLRDLALACAGGNADFYNRDFSARIQGLVAKVRGWIEGEIAPEALAAELAEKCSAIHRFRVKRSFNLSIRLGLDTLISDLQIFSVGKIRRKL